MLSVSTNTEVVKESLHMCNDYNIWDNLIELHLFNWKSDKEEQGLLNPVYYSPGENAA